MPDPLQVTIDTYDRIAPEYGLTDVPSLRAWKEKSMDYFRSRLAGPRVLVPGCGHGRDSAYLRSKGLSVLSFDLSESMLREARAYDPMGQYVYADMRTISSVPGSFDGVFACGCLYHLTKHELRAFLADIADKLNSEAVLYISMKMGCGDELKEFPGSEYPGGEPAQTALIGPRFYQYYEHSELLSLFSRFELIRWRPVDEQPEGVNEYWLRLP